MHAGFYQVVFTDKEDYNFVLYEGPWMVVYHYRITQHWRPFLMHKEVTKKVVVWIHIQRLPIELYNDIFLKRVGMVLGNFLKIDRLNHMHSRGKFMHIFIELDLGKPLLTHIVVKGFLLNLEYEGLHLICFNCSHLGHKKDGCSEPIMGMKKVTRKVANVTKDMKEVNVQ